MALDEGDQKTPRVTGSQTPLKCMELFAEIDVAELFLFFQGSHDGSRWDRGARRLVDRNLQEGENRIDIAGIGKKLILAIVGLILEETGDYSDDWFERSRRIEPESPSSANCRMSLAS